MTSIPKRVLFLAVVALATAAGVQARQQAALLTDVAGPVQVTRAAGGAPQAATWGMQLNVGDRVVTGQGARASLLYSATNSLVAVGANATHDVSAGAASGATASRPVGAGRIAAVSDLTLARAGEGEVSALGGLRAGESRKSIQTLTPRQTRIAAGRPTFAWMSADEFEEFRVRLYDAAGKEVWSGTTAAGKLVYPETAPALAAGTRYLWKVEGEEMLDVVTSEMASFDVLDADSQVEVDAGLQGIAESFAGSSTDDASRDYVLGAFYADHGMLADAVVAFSRIAHRYPEAALVHEILGKLYYDLGLKDEAVGALQRALQVR